MPSRRAFTGRRTLFGAVVLAPALLLLQGGGAAARETTPAVQTAAVPEDLRLETIGYRLASANADRCENPNMLTGMMLHDIAAYAPRYRAAVTQAQGLTFGFGVRRIVPGSVGAAAGIQPGDEIVAVNGAGLQDFAQNLIGSGATYDRTEQFVTYLDAALVQGPAVITLRRAGAPIEIKLAGQPGCGGQLVLTPSSRLNAWADGKYVAITTKMLRYTRDDQELAFVVAHEMSHNILHHLDGETGTSGLFAELGFGAKDIKDDEMQADGFAIGLMARAGFDLTAPERFLRRSGRSRWMDLAITHPGVSRRVAIVNAAIGNIDAARSSGGAIGLASADSAGSIAIGLRATSAKPSYSSVAALTAIPLPGMFDWPRSAAVQAVPLTNKAPAYQVRYGSAEPLPGRPEIRAFLSDAALIRLSASVPNRCEAGPAGQASAILAGADQPAAIALAALLR